MKTTVVIGGGPAGMMSAIEASRSTKVILLESNAKLGKKLFITGKGRCNITNAKDINDFFDFIPGNPAFLYSALYSFTNENTMDFFEKAGVKLKVERGGRVFPESDKSSDILNAFNSELSKRNVEVRLNSKVTKILKVGNKISCVVLENGEKVYGDYFILCTGGKSYPLTGSTGDGYTFSASLGHKIVPLRPSLVPIEVQEAWVKELQGLSLKNVEFKIYENNKCIFRDFGEMLFTHFGVSGPIVLSGSRKVKDNANQYASIDLKPALSEDELDKRIQKDFEQFKNKDIKNALNELLPQKIINRIIIASGIPDDKKVHSITRQERKCLVHAIKDLRLQIKSLRPIAEAIVTAGGVDTKEIDPSTMNSKIISNLYFAGEVIDVDAYTGGYNIQIALSTGYLAGKAICEKEKL
ncbi:NAD(P)/FAD-dependent oxidoreductase [Clostridium thermarum]|uniref:NAD(P)/FAD-dependent oxidoreductase n=1 Tax=Clostridium thermarum TaxID=1716543 RepID=UPI0013D4EA5E|nr:NAD(P)/FAD-dependent oxidoreductase [Clostridium thermarum]